MGWHPLAGPGVDPADAYSGPRDKWVPAREYVEAAYERMPIMRTQLRKTTQRLTKAAEQIDGLTNTVQEQAQAIAELRRIAQSANEAGYNRAKAEIEADMREAVRAGDEEAFDQAKERADALEKERAKHAPAPQPSTPVVDPAIAAWERQHSSWWNIDKTLSQAMISHHNIVAAKHPAMPLADQLKLATDNLKRDFPEKFGIQPAADDDDEGEEPQMPRRQVPAALTPNGPGAGRQVPRRRGASPFDVIDDLAEREQAKAAFERIRRGDPSYTAEEYMAVYQDPHADVLALRKKRK